MPGSPEPELPAERNGELSTGSRLWHPVRVGLACLGLIVIAYLAYRSQPRPPRVYFDDSWPLIAWKVHRLIDFRRAAYTAFGFILLERFSLELLSFSTVHARWLPLLFTLMIGPEFLLVAIWMRIRYPAALLGAVLLVTSPELVSMATHVKQYSLDVVLGIALLGLAMAIIRKPSSTRRWVAFSVVAALALVGSFAVVGVVGAGVVAGLLALLRERVVPRRARVSGVVSSVLVAIFALAWYTLMLRPIIPFSALTGFWSGAFLDAGSWKQSWLLIYVLFQAGFAIPAMVSVIVLGVATALVIARRPLHAVLFGAPIVFAIVGSFARQVPLGAGRTDTWLYGVYPLQPNIAPLIPKLEAARRPGDLVVVASPFTFSYPLYAPQKVVTKPTDRNVAGWFPVVEGANVLMTSITPDPPVELHRRLKGVRGVWLLDAPGSFQPLAPPYRSMLTQQGFELVGSRRSTLGLLERWQRRA